MAVMAPDVSQAAAYGSKFAPGIILKFWAKLAEQGITVYPNIKGPTKFGKMSVGAGLKPYDGTFDPPGQVTFTDRTLTPDLATYELRIQPLKYYNTWMADQISASVAKKTIPFANYMWQEIANEVGDEVVTSTLFKGDVDYVGANKAIKVTDGLSKLIIDINPTPASTGALASATVIDQFEETYALLSSKYRKIPMNLYCSWASLDMYNKKYRELYHDKPTYNEFTQTVLDVSAGKCMITPVDWLEGDELIITPKSNLVMGTDAESDMSTIKTIETIYGFDAAITFSIGFQIPDTEVLFVNDQALLPVS